jgi:DNA-binding transcriptional ArsR family regulator
MTDMAIAGGDEAHGTLTPATADADRASLPAARDNGHAVRDGEQARGKPMFEFIEKFAAVLIAAGFPPMPARVFVALLVTDSGRLSASELVDLLHISPAAVSGAVRYLAGIGLVHKERVPGSRREYYRMPGDIWHQVMWLRNQVLTRWTALLREGIDLVGSDSPAGRRMTGHAAFFEFLAAEMPAILARWDAVGHTE